MNFTIPLTSGQTLPITLDDGHCLFMVGANGSGKSALIQHLVVSHGNDKIRRITAHRQTAFDSDRPNFTYPDRGQFEQQIRQRDLQPDARWKEDRQFGQQKQLAVLSDLIDKENSQARSVRDLVRDDNICEAKKASSGLASPFGQINELFRIGNLTVLLELSKAGEILAHHRSEDKFRIAQMSDGERSAAIMAATVLTVEQGTVLLIDEPERHLHRSIVEPFLSALFEQRKDCAFVISTHETALPAANPDARVLMIRSCRWEGETVKSWDVDLLEAEADLPEELKLAILGARRKILFVEGTSSSLDLPLYSALFPDVSVEPRGNCGDIQKAVKGLRESEALHHVKAFGLIDKDNRSEEKTHKLEKEGVFALEVCSVESLYYCSDAIAAVACWQEKSHGSKADELIELAKTGALEVLKQNDIAERMAFRRCERQLHDLIISKLTGLKVQIRKDKVSRLSVCVNLPYPEELERFRKLVADGKLDDLFARYPLRESGVFDKIAKALECGSLRKYQNMVPIRVQNDENLAHKLKGRINRLSCALDAEVLVSEKDEP